MRHQAREFTISKIEQVELSSVSYTYDGKVQRPGVTVKDSKGKTLKNGTDYTVSYSSGCKCKNVARYAIKVTLWSKAKSVITKK